jgi:hypothetical protein
VAADATQPAVLPADFPMRPSLKALRSNASDRAHRAAEGATPPAGQDPLPLADLATPGAVERGTLRRRLRRARRVRETLLTELGALVMEMHRQRRHDPALVERKSYEALVADREALGLARALGEDYSVTQVVAAGIAGSCYVCGSLLGTDDRYCARCGTAAVGARNGPPRPPATAPPPPDPTARSEPPPPDPGARVRAPAGPPGAPGAAAPPPDPTTRVHPSTGASSAPIGFGTPGR